jgi:hypothetical protein
MYVVSLDAEKAFDKVWRPGLFFKLLNKIPLNIWYSLNQYYNSSDSLIKINGQTDTENVIKTKCGVKQGGILSPNLFNLYYNDLINECCDLSIGAFIGEANHSIIVYADDIILLSPSLHQLQTLVHTCESYGKEWFIKFNEKKSVALQSIHNLYDDSHLEIKLNGKMLNVVNEFKYLGCSVNKFNDLNENTKQLFTKVRSAFFSLQEFGIKSYGLQPYTKSFIYKSLCLSKFLYPIGVISIKNKLINELNVAQNMLIRYMFGLNRYTHISSIGQVLDILPIDLLHLKFIAITIRLMKNHPLTNNFLNKIYDFDNDFNLLFEDQKALYVQKILDNNIHSPILLNMVKIVKCFNLKIVDIIHDPNKILNQINLKFMETESVEIFNEIKTLLFNYNFENCKKLKSLISLI